MSNDEWGTPQWLYDRMFYEFPFELDVCASEQNHKCKNYITKEMDSFKTPWADWNWCNPPYSDQLPWIKRAIDLTQEGKKTVMLPMCDTSTEAFKLCAQYGSVRLINHRITFEGASGAPRFASMIVVFGYPGERKEIEVVDYRRFIK